MTIESISAVAPAIGAEQITTGGAANKGVDFSSWLTQQMNEVNSQINAAEAQVNQLAVGETGNLHEVMLSLEKAKLSFELVVQVRNKLLEGYQEIMRMQI